MGNWLNGSNRKQGLLASYSGITPQQLFNLQADLWSNYLILDCRSKKEFDVGNIDLSEHYSLSFDKSKLKAADVVILYYSSHVDLINGDLLSTLQTKCVRLLNAGYEEYRKLYPFLCTDNANYVRGTLYPSEIDHHIYLSNLGVGTHSEVLEKMSITHIVNCTADCPFPEHWDDLHVLRVPAIDSTDVQIGEHFETIVHFMELALSLNQNSKVLFYCKHGQSRSPTCVIAWLMFNGLSFDEAYKHVKNCRPKSHPNAGFISQLVHWEEKLKNSHLLDGLGYLKINYNIIA